MIAVVLVHISPYPLYVWSYTKYRGTFHPRAGERIPIYLRLIFSFLLLVFPVAFFGLFTYGFPLILLGDGQYCPGDAGSITNNAQYCKSAEDAGEDPFVFVFLPTFLMWLFDTVAFGLLGLLKQQSDLGGSDNNNTGCNVFCGEISRVMFPRYGLALVYCGLICFARSLRTGIELEQPDISSGDIDTGKKLSFVERQKTAGIILFALASVVWSIPIAIFFSKRACTRKRSGDNTAENQEHDKYKYTTLKLVH